MTKLKHGNKIANQPAGTFVLPSLPFDANKLEPHLSANTFSFHHGKHHNAYVTNLNNLLKDKADFQNLDLEEIIMKSAGKQETVGLFNNAAQIWNHTFYWNSMKPNGGGRPSGELMDKIASDFGSYEKFVEEFKQAATTQFGSGWAWLVVDSEGKLKVRKTGNAELPLTNGEKALLTIDVWEHAYYIDYQNRRPDYITTFIEHLVNWDFALDNLKA
ncbi:MAG: superoxide dismutase [Alphaproteobacteria bacterium]|nr:superoxide dismutase [Alphaproteobacteria bacterium]OJV13875.1 MAG: superoxide dismutase [Alphaproteobacteria bacterium 33-17]